MAAEITVNHQVCLTYRANNYTLPYYFVGVNEEDARAKLNDWLNKKPVVINTGVDGEGEITTPSDGRRQFAGKVWLINHKEQTRARVNPEDVDTFLEKGYVYGGPKTAFIKG